MAQRIDLVKTGIPGADAILDGGIYPGSAVLVSGPPGSGKSIFGMQFIYSGAADYGEGGLIVAMEETDTSLSGYAASIGLGRWDELVKAGSITMVTDDYFSKTDLPGSLEGIMERVSRTSAKRIVLDSVNLFKYFFPQDMDRRRYLLKFIRILKKRGITSLMISEAMGVFPDMPLTEEMFMSDGNISLFLSRAGNNVERCFWVTKMRRQAFSMKIVPMSIGRGGVEVFPDAVPYSLTAGE
ncbi:MAG TPA: ATPase domain-containing protein [Methanocella sp.]|nr:ATPase domain-containing protein [Methanocella sp.]